MTIEILMPALSPTMTEGNLTKWLIQKGDTVKATYIIYLLNVLPFYGALIIDRINKFDPRLFKAFLSILFVILAHNIPTMMTRF